MLKEFFQSTFYLVAAQSKRTDTPTFYTNNLTGSSSKAFNV